MSEGVLCRRLLATVLAMGMTLGQLACTGPLKGPLNADEAPANHRRAGEMPTDEELEIARDLGCSDDYCEKIAREGLNEWGAQYLGTAALMRSLLEEKYGLSFAVSELVGPELLSPAWYLKARVTSGQYKDIEVEARLPAQPGGSMEDNLVPRAREDSLVAYVDTLVDEVYADQGIHVASDSFVVDSLRSDVTLDMDVRELARTMMVTTYIYVSPWEEMTHSRYIQLVRQFVARLRERDVKCQWFVRRILTPTSPDGTVTVRKETFDPAFAEWVLQEGVEGTDWEWSLDGCCD